MRIARVNDLAVAVEVLRRIIAFMPQHTLAWIAVNGMEAVARCREDTPDLILTTELQFNYTATPLDNPYHFSHIGTIP